MRVKAGKALLEVHHDLEGELTKNPMINASVIQKLAPEEVPLDKSMIVEEILSLR